MDWNDLNVADVKDVSVKRLPVLIVFSKSNLMNHLSVNKSKYYCMNTTDKRRIIDVCIRFGNVSSG